MATTQRILPGVGLIEQDDSTTGQALLPGAGVLDMGAGGAGGGGPGASAAIIYVINS